MILIGDDFVPSPSSLIYGYIYICPHIFSSSFDTRCWSSLRAWRRTRARRKRTSTRCLTSGEEKEKVINMMMMLMMVMMMTTWWWQYDDANEKYNEEIDWCSAFLMPDFDADGDGVISKEEFESGMNKWKMWFIRLNITFFSGTKKT